MLGTSRTLAGMIVPDKLAETLDRVINRCGAGISFLKTSVQVRAQTGLNNAATLGCRGPVPYADHNRLAVQDRHSLSPVRRRVSSTTPRLAWEVRTSLEQPQGPL